MALSLIITLKLTLTVILIPNHHSAKYPSQIFRILPPPREKRDTRKWSDDYRTRTRAWSAGEVEFADYVMKMEILYPNVQYTKYRGFGALIPCCTSGSCHIWQKMPRIPAKMLMEGVIPSVTKVRVTVHRHLIVCDINESLFTGALHSTLSEEWVVLYRRDIHA